MPRLLGVAAVLGLFSLVESFGLLLIGIRVLSHSHLRDYFRLASEDQLQTVMFLQLVVGGHLLLFVTRTERRSRGSGGTSGRRNWRPRSWRCSCVPLASSSRRSAGR